MAVGGRLHSWHLGGGSYKPQLGGGRVAVGGRLHSWEISSPADKQSAIVQRQGGVRFRHHDRCSAAHSSRAPLCGTYGCTGY